MSQEYTPVDWVDETTSQQGTLINAERLDQMQTAHHYADGFEEVDAIPTEDPGVDYHKIVYCTADTTFYRWDGTQWTADIDEETKQLLDQEIARATAAEGELAQDIEDEATARAQADTALGERITAEAGAREGADTALGARIDAEAEDRADADRQIWAQFGSLNSQVIPMYPGSSTPTIHHSIMANNGLIENLTSVVDGLTYDLGQEVTNRENADTQLAADITAEVQARAAAIASLQAGVYTKTEADNLLAAKADKATTLAGYGITDAVTLGTQQEITANKTFNGAVYFDGRFELKQNNPYAHIVNSGYVKGTAPSSNKISDIRFEDSSSNPMAKITHTMFSDGDGTLRLATSNAADNNSGELVIGATAGGQHFVRASYRDYAPGNTGDVATIGTLDQYAPMVRTSGNQEIGGNKTLTGLTDLSCTRLVPTGGSGYKILYRFKSDHTQTLFITGGRTIVVAQVHRGGGYKKVLATAGRDYSTTPWLWSVKDATTGEYYLVCHGLYSATMNVHFVNSFQYGTVYPHQDDIEIIDQSTSDPTTDTRWETVTEVGNYD